MSFAAYPDCIAWFYGIITFADTRFPTPIPPLYLQGKTCSPSLVVLRLSSVSESPGGQVRLTDGPYPRHCEISNSRIVVV